MIRSASLPSLEIEIERETYDQQPLRVGLSFETLANLKVSSKLINNCLKFF